MLIITVLLPKLLAKIMASFLMQNVDLTEKSRTLWNINNLFSYIKMGKEILTFEDIEIEKDKSYGNKIPVSLKDVDIEKMLVSNEVSFG